MNAQEAVVSESPDSAVVNAKDSTVKDNQGSDVILDKIVIKGQSATAQARRELSSVAGGTSLIDSRSLSRRKVTNIADVLDQQPGVLAQSLDGGEATRVSIRGSGVSSVGFYWSRGVQTFIDGFALYGPAGGPYESVEPWALDHVEILRGANGFAYGPLTLGGAINYVTRTGYNASPFQVRFEAGSDGYLHEQISSGQVLGNLDYYISATGFNYNGWRDGSEANSQRVVANVGYRFNSDLDTRFYFRWARQNQDQPGFLTWSQLEQNPRQSQYPFRDDSTQYHPGSFTVGNKTTWKIDNTSSLQVGVQWRNYPEVANASPRATWDVSNWYSEADAFVNYRREDTVFGDHRSLTTASLYYNRILSSEAEGYLQGGGGPVLGRENSPGYDLVAVLQNDFELRSRTWLTLGLSAIRQQRTLNEEQYLAWDSGAPTSQTSTYNSLAPRLGLRYDITPDVQVFANASRSYEAPSTSAFATSVFGGTYIPNLKAQSANTLEIGTRGKRDGLAWSLDYYRSWVNNELLYTLYTTPTGYQTTGVSNSSSPTIHQGIEASLDTRLWKFPTAGEITLRQSFTLNDFYYRHDSAFGHNSLPGIPRQLYQAELAYSRGSGFYVAANVEASLTKYAADYANTIWAKPYAVFGLKAGYSPSRHWDLYAQAVNITNKKYAALVNPVYNAGGVDTAVYAPGVGRTFVAGFSYSY